jgi:hypothetical protein
MNPPNVMPTLAVLTRQELSKKVLEKTIDESHTTYLTLSLFSVKQPKHTRFNCQTTLEDGRVAVRRTARAAASQPHISCNKEVGMAQEWYYMTPLPRFESVTVAAEKESREVSLRSMQRAGTYVMTSL